MIGLWWRAVRFRPLSTLVLLVLTTVAVATAAVGPLLIRAVQQSALADTVADAGVSAGLVEVSVTLDPGQAYEQSRQQVLLPFAGLDPDVWRTPVLNVTTTENVSWSTGTTSRVVAAEADCAGVALTEGRCPVYPGETLLATSDTGRGSARLGSVVRFAPSGGSEQALKVVGTYDPTRSLPGLLVRPAGGTVATAGEGSGIEGPPTADSFVVTPAELQRLKMPVKVTAATSLSDGVRVTELAGVRATLADVSAEAGTAVPGRTLFYGSSLGNVLDRADRLTADAVAVITMTVVQAVAVALFALAIVVQRVGRARAAEWGIGRLRGVPRPRWYVGILLEPAVPLLLGLPLGLGAAVLLARAATGAALRPGTPVEPWRWPVLGAGAAAFLAAAVTLAVVGTASVRRPTVELIQQGTERKALGRIALAGQAVVVLLAGAALYQLLATGSLTSGGSRLALLAPALLALAVALLAVRGAVLLVRRATARPPRSRAGLVVGRQLGRLPSSLNPAVVVAAGLALTVLAGQVHALSVRNQDLRARADVGAATVLGVQVPAGTDLLAEVAAADPTGRYAMAAVETDPATSNGTSRILAVDSSRYAAVAAWPVAGVQQLGTGLADPIVLRGTKLTVRVADVAVTTGPGTEIPPTQGVPFDRPRLQAVVANARGWFGVDLGVLAGGGAERTGALEGCSDGCRLVGFDVVVDDGGNPTAYDARFSVTALRTDRQPTADLAAGLGAPGWHGVAPDLQQNGLAPPTVQAGVDGGALTIAIKTTSGLDQSVAVAAGDSREPAPAIFAQRTPVVPVVGYPGAALGNGLSGQAVLLVPVGSATVLPRSLTDGVLLDLTQVARTSDSGLPGINEVWLAADAPPTVEAALEQAGIRVQTRESLADARTALDRQPVTRGSTIALTIGWAALALALITLAASRLADLGRQRARWRSLREAGLRRPATVGLAVLEIALPAVIASVLGAAAGAVVVVLAAPRLPLVDGAEDGPALDLGLAAEPIALAVGLAVAAVLVLAVLLAVVETAGRREERA